MSREAADTGDDEGPTDTGGDDGRPADRPTGDRGTDAEELAAQVDLLREENRRLRREYARARRSAYRRTALGFAVLGLVALGGAAAFPGARTVLLALAGTGLFAGVLVRYLTPERFVAATVGERVYAALASTGEALVADLGLSEARVYLPADAGEDPAGTPVRLFVPQHVDYDLPGTDALKVGFVAGDDERARGVVLPPTGAELFSEFERALAGPLAEDPTALAEQLLEGLGAQFELVEGGRVDTVERGDGGRLAVGVSGSAYGAVDRFDHPVTSFLATGVAVGLERPVTAAVDSGDDRSEYLVTVSWEDTADGRWEGD